MRAYEDYFRVKDHIEEENPESIIWTAINSTGLAEVMEMAEQHGYTYKLNCYDETVDLNGDSVRIHRRTMIFIKDPVL